MTRGYIYWKTRKNTVAMLFWAAVLMVLYILYLNSAFVYLINAHTSGFKLDTEDLLSNIKMLTIKQESEPFGTQEHFVTIPPDTQSRAVRGRIEVSIQVYSGKL